MRKEEAIGFILLFFTAFTVLLLTSAFLWEGEFFHLRTVAYLEKALLAAEGSPPRLENVGFVYPPLPVYLLVPFKEVAPVQGLTGGLSFLFLLLLAKKAGNLKPALFSLPASLPFLYLGSVAFDKLLTFTLLASSAFLLFLYLRENFSLYLFSGGLLYGLTFFVDFSTLTLLPLYFLYFLGLKEDPFKRLSTALVFTFPLLFFTFFYAFVNYAFKGDPLYFLKSHVPTLSALLTTKAHPAPLHLLLAFTYLSGLFLLKVPRFFYLLPLFYLFSLFYANPVKELTDFGLSPFLSCLLFLLLFAPLRGKVAFAFLLVFLLTLNGAFLLTDDRNERNFVKAFLGLPYEKNLSYYKEVARYLNGLEGTILMDDEGLYPSVVFVKERERLLLPYRSEYYTYLFSPWGNVDYAVVKTLFDEDDLYRLYKETLRKKLGKCQYYGEVRDVKVFRCSAGSPSERMVSGEGILSSTALLEKPRGSGKAL